MRVLSIEVPEETAAKLERAAEECGMSVSELVRQTLEAKARDLPTDYKSAADHVLEKNAELYRRLS